jgi:hypothetical protein
VVEYLIANRGGSTWIVAANGSMEAGALQLAAGQPVMAMGGFNGSDPAPTPDQLKAHIAGGHVRFVIAGGGAGLPGGSNVGSTRNAWVTANCVAVTIAGTAVTSLYDCAGAA